VILSHARRFIFLKTSKTAGTSIEIALSQLCGERDVITPISPEDEKIRQRLGFRGPQNYLAPLADYGPRDLGRLLVGRRKARFYNHMSAREILQHVGRDVWDSYYKFCFERNPWDRVISYYYWRYRSEPRPDLAAFVASEIPARLRLSGFALYTLDGEIAVDRVCRYEDLAGELARIRARLGVAQELTLPRAKSSLRPAGTIERSSTASRSRASAGSSKRRSACSAMSRSRSDDRAGECRRDSGCRRRCRRATGRD